jgi:hypothetical protein
MASINAPATVAAPQIQTMPANSSFIAAFEYDQANLTLTTHLKNGAIYQHKFVVPLDWLALQTSQNHSKHWSDNIRGKKASVRVKVAKAPRSDIRKKGR